MSSARFAATSTGYVGNLATVADLRADHNSHHLPVGRTRATSPRPARSPLDADGHLVHAGARLRRRTAAPPWARRTPVCGTPSRRSRRCTRTAGSRTSPSSTRPRQGLDDELADAVLGVGHDGQGSRGQDLPGRVHRLADASLGARRSTPPAPAAAATATTSSGRATTTSRSPVLLSAGDLSAAADARSPGCSPGSSCADGHFPQNSARRRHPGPDQRPARRDRIPDHPRPAGRRHRRRRSTPTTSPRRPTTSSPAVRRRRRSAGRRPAATRPSTLADDDRRSDRGRRPRDQGRGRRRRSRLPGHRRRVAAQHREVDVHHERQPLGRQLLRPDQRQREPERRRHAQLGQRRRRASRERHRRRRLPRADPPRASRPRTTPTSRTPCWPSTSRSRPPHPQRRPGKRYTFDGYGETADGAPWTGNRGSAAPWPLLAGERGEYVLGQRWQRPALPAAPWPTPPTPGT